MKQIGIDSEMSEMVAELLGFPPLQYEFEWHI